MKVDGYVLCDDWTNVRKFRPVLYPKFSTTDRAAASQILYVKTYSPGCEFYSVPSYIGALNWIELEYEVSNFHLSSVHNGFTPGMLINFNAGVPTDEEIEEMVRDMKAQYAGARNGQNPMITFSEGKDGAPTFTPIELNASDKRFIELNRNITEGIMAGHRVVNPNLFGIKESGEGIGSSDIIDYLNIFNAEYVIPKQKLIEKVYNRLIRVNNNEDKLVLNKFILKLDVKTSTTDILSILTSTISDDQKRQTLQLVGITQEESIKLVPIENKLTP